MKRKIAGLTILFFIAFIFSRGIVFSYDTCLLLRCERKELSIGEKLTFRVHLGMPIGTITMETKKTKWQGQEVYSILTISRPSFPFSLLYPGVNIAESLIDIDTFLPVIHKSTEEIRDEKKIRLTVFDREQKRAKRFHNGVMHSSIPVAPDARDGLSATFCYLRTRPLNVGESISINISTGRRNIEAEFKVLERRRWRRRDIIVVESTPEGIGLEGLFGEGGNVQIWFTDDECRLPLVIRRHGTLNLVRIILIDRVHCSSQGMTPGLHTGE